MKLIVGLGNPGREYQNTRHNIGFNVLDRYADKNNLSFNKEKFNGMYCELKVNGESIILLKPLSYMNLSGEVVRKFMDYFKINYNDILVICDDLDLDVGRYRLKQKGSCGGHNGLRNIELHIGTQEYKRLKIGISNNKMIDTKDYVLGKFSNDENNTLNNIYNLGVDIINDFLVLNFSELMNKYNHR